MKNNPTLLAVCLVFLLVFNAVFFILGGTSHVSSVWISYGFIQFACIAVMTTPLLAKQSAIQYRSNLSLYAVSAFYFVVVFIVGMVFVFLNQDSYKPALLAQIIVFGAYAAILILNVFANEKNSKIISQEEQEALFTKMSAARIKDLLNQSTDKQVKRDMEHLYDLLHGSPTKSSPFVQSTEKEISASISELEEGIMNHADNILATITYTCMLVEKRNAILKQQSL